MTTSGAAETAEPVCTCGEFSGTSVLYADCPVHNPVVGKHHAEQAWPEPFREIPMDEVRASFDRHAGELVCGIGEDDDTLILGHPDAAACWAAYADFTGDTAEAGQAWHDLRRVQVTWANHSEGCEWVGCECSEDECEGGCVNECYCDEYGWWVSEVRLGGEPATFVSYSYEKARARNADRRREALREPPVVGGQR